MVQATKMKWGTVLRRRIYFLPLALTLFSRIWTCPDSVLRDSKAPASAQKRRPIRTGPFLIRSTIRTIRVQNGPFYYRCSQLTFADGQAKDTSDITFSGLEFVVVFSILLYRKKLLTISCSVRILFSARPSASMALIVRRSY